jgi:hypothetical protein
MAERYAARGMQGYAEILAAIRVYPSSAWDIHRHLGVTEFEAARIMVRMTIHGIAHVHDWHRREPGKHVSARWKMGGGPSAPRPTTTAAGRPLVRESRKPEFKPELFTFCQVVKALESGATVRAVCELCGLTYGAANNLVKHMRKLRLIHVSEWEKPEFGPRTRVYMLGDIRDAKRPPLETDKQRNARYWQQKKARRDTAMIVGLTAGSAIHPLAQTSEAR